jgi:hypothetical protein
VVKGIREREPRNRRKHMEERGENGRKKRRGEVEHEAKLKKKKKILRKINMSYSENCLSTEFTS